MRRAVTYDLKDNFIERIADHICRDMPKGAEDNDFSNIACVFTGLRQALFLNKELSNRLKREFFPPKAFSMDNLAEYIISGEAPYARLTELNASCLVYGLCKDIAPEILKGREAFSDFLPWAKQIASFIEKLDFEDVSAGEIENVKQSASIGYDVPHSINSMLKKINKLRQSFHRIMDERRAYSRGYLYLKASKQARSKSFNEFSKIYICNFFYMQKTEIEIIKHLYDNDKADLFFQGDCADWSVLEDLSKKIGCKIVAHCNAPLRDKLGPNISLYAGFDSVSQAATARQILEKTRDHNNSVILMPDNAALMPLLCEIGPLVDDFNISSGYPLWRSSLYDLLKAVFEAQIRRTAKGYYTKDYLRVISHPLLKNLSLNNSNVQVTGILVHKTEEVLIGKEKTSLGGSLFIDIDGIKDLEHLHIITIETLKGMGIEVSIDEIKSIHKSLHEILFVKWENLPNFKEFMNVLNEVLKIIIDNCRDVVGTIHELSLQRPYFMLNLTIADKLYEVIEELENSLFAEEEFKKEDLFRIFDEIARNTVVKFQGTPLKGLQILDLFETHCLNFKNVIVLDANEGILPAGAGKELLIPAEVMISLGINRIAHQDEIQRYQFMRLLSGAENIHLIYRDDAPAGSGAGKTERSRFVEEIVWEKQKSAKDLNAAPVRLAQFKMFAQGGKKHPAEEKNSAVMEAMGKIIYSATSVDAYLNCPRQFYFKHVLRLPEKEQLQDDIEGVDVGRFIHELLEDAFGPFLLRKPVIDKVFKENFFQKMDKHFDRTLLKRMKSDSFMVREVLKTKLEQFLYSERQRGACAERSQGIEKIVCLEKKYEGTVKTKIGHYNFVSKVDRVDHLSSGELLIIDYKTGYSAQPPAKKIEKYDAGKLDRRIIRKAIKSFQLPIYLHVLSQCEEFVDKNMNAALYNMRDAELVPLWKNEDDGQKKRLMNFYITALGCILDEINDASVPFIPDEEEMYCENCPFFYACR